MIFTRCFLASILVSLLLGACSVLELPVVEGAGPVPTAELPAAATGTPTIVWFPASPTPAPLSFATYTATPEMRPGVGNTTVSDSFTDAKLWDTATSNEGSASVERNRLTLAVQPEVYLFSLRHGLSLDDFYAEITARPNLCRGADDYGVLIRASVVVYYRFSLNCNGMAQVDRISAGSRQLLQSAVPSGDAPRGSPGEVRIGVWAVESEMRLFLNGRYQFTVTHPSPRSGTIGVFARSAGDTPVTITFSDLTIQDVSYAPPTRTLAP